MNKNTNDLRHSNRQITWGCFPLQCYLAGSWAVLFPAACTSAGLLPFFSFGCQVSSLSLSADRLILPLISWCQAHSVAALADHSCLSVTSPVPHLQGFLSSHTCLCSPFCLHIVSPQCLVSELADCKVKR